jgi:hypothetical protein
LAQRADPTLGAKGAGIALSPVVVREGGIDDVPAGDAVAHDAREATGQHALPNDGAAVGGSEEMDALEMSREVAQAIRDRDAERIEQIARRAVLEGVGMAEIARLRALADLLRGDVGGAARSLVKARSLVPSAAVGRRALLTEAMVALRAGLPMTAVRFGLRALAEARAEGDSKGESVALFVIAASYRALGRDADASTLEQAGQL